MKYSVFTAMMKDMSPEETVRKIKSFGYDGIEWGVDDSYSIKFREAVKDAEHFKKITYDQGLEIPAVGTGLEINEQEKIKQMFDICARMECPQFRVTIPWYGADWEQIKKADYHLLYKEARKQLQILEEVSQSYGIKVLIETHFGNICPSAGLAYNLVKDFDPKCIGVIYDPGNMIVEGRECWKMGIELLGKYLAHVHVKNLLWRYETQDSGGEGNKLSWQWDWADMPEGMVDWKEVIDSLKLTGYNKYLSLEDFSQKPIDDRLKVVDYLRRFEQEG